MRGRPDRPTPQTPAEHHAEAIAYLNDADDYPVTSAAHLVMVMRAATHASLALYTPTAAPARGRGRQPAKPKEE